MLDDAMVDDEEGEEGSLVLVRRSGLALRSGMIC